MAIQTGICLISMKDHSQPEILVESEFEVVGCEIQNQRPCRCQNTDYNRVFIFFNLHI